MSGFRKMTEMEGGKLMFKVTVMYPYAEGARFVSATGTGEYFIRLSVAYAICARIELTGETAQEAADYVIHTSLTGLQGDGGVIFLGDDGRPGWSFNTKGMYRASAYADGEEKIGIYGE